MAIFTIGVDLYLLHARQAQLVQCVVDFGHVHD